MAPYATSTRKANIGDLGINRNRETITSLSVFSSLFLWNLPTGSIRFHEGARKHAEDARGYKSSRTADDACECFSLPPGSQRTRTSTLPFLTGLEE